LDGGLKWINDEVQQVQIKIKELDLAKEKLTLNNCTQKLTVEGKT